MTETEEITNRVYSRFEPLIAENVSQGSPDTQESLETLPECQEWNPWRPVAIAMVIETLATFLLVALYFIWRWLR